MKKNAAQKIFLYLPYYLQKLIKLIFIFLTNPRIISAYKAYIFSDEHNKYLHILEAMNYLRVAGDGGYSLPQTYFEFGCHSGRTFSAAIRAAKFLKMNNANFYAFDSFSGLPITNKEEDGIFKAGEFHTAKNDFIKIIKSRTGLRMSEQNIIQGYYSESLTKNLQERLPSIGIAYIDVDLYSSTQEVLNFIYPLLVKGSLLMFDDWYCFPVGDVKGERKALEEFLRKHPSLKLEPWKEYSTFGKSFFVTEIN